jgi:hypothetical protein
METKQTQETNRGGCKMKPGDAIKVQFEPTDEMLARYADFYSTGRNGTYKTRGVECYLTYARPVVWIRGLTSRGHAARGDVELPVEAMDELARKWLEARGKSDNRLRDLLLEALDCVDADEEARAESWPGEVEKGELVLDLGERIRHALGL